MGRSKRHSQPRATNVERLGRELQRDWLYGKRNGASDVHAYLGRTLLNSESIVEMLEAEKGVSVISAEDKLVLPLMHRRAFGPGANRGQLARALAELGQTSAIEVEFGKTYSKSQAIRTATRPTAVRLPLASGSEVVRHEYDVISCSLSKGRAGNPILDLRVAEVADERALATVEAAVWNLTSGVLSPVQMLEVSRVRPNS